ncbi:protein of unknown function [Magnetospirillum gryphiswaldense MSR-1 v2]|uniref:Alpha-L-glutamate ligase-related protein ATP-grasp domain-containing protein n=1 Tax=Magnetospirillum gryphiswaldense (strain DSM 6361 / JCM 21280 / NBRC 15271 / MSR-1) TaxID=431944 RepID=V6EX34_MAGGM|nr:sugar-transfer associated ATP-grasp domain-containing protein [Magnetospirillum gryphiswaldense]CDK97805.1 protein of unknown function [Magnetospirillum gryphiswaldense MSR-1 v2]
MWEFFRSIWIRLPVDGSGIFGSWGRSTAARIRSVTASRLWRNRVPSWALPVLVPVVRMAWLIACPAFAVKAVRRSRSTFCLGTWCKLTADGWFRGLHPMDSANPEIPNELVTSCAVEGLGERHWIRLWSVLGSRGDQALAKDKLAMAESLGKVGVPTPRLLAELPRGGAVRLGAWSGGDRVFIKPRHGSRAQGTLSLRQTTDPNVVLVSRGRFPTRIMPREAVEGALTKLAETDTLVVQEFLNASPEMSDLSADAPVELRLTTARAPGCAARVIAASAKIQPPGYHSATTLNIGLMIPVDPESGVMGSGFYLRAPGESFPYVPWNNAPIKGRALHSFARAVDLVEAGSRLLPDLPVIGWDVVLSDRGPVVLEANTGLSWNFIHLWHGSKKAASPLMPLVLAWLDRFAPLPRSR